MVFDVDKTSSRAFASGSNTSSKATIKLGRTVAKISRMSDETSHT